MKLISAAQKNQLVTIERVLAGCSPTSMDFPELQGIESAKDYLARKNPVQTEAPVEAPSSKDLIADAFGTCDPPAGSSDVPPPSAAAPALMSMPNMQASQMQ